MMTIQTNGEMLPPDWKMTDDTSITCLKTVQDKNYYLNDKKTAIKLTKAAKADDLVVGVNKDKSYTLFLSTGAYVRTVIPLLNFYKKVLQSSTPVLRKNEVAGLTVEVKSVRPAYDKNRTPVQYTVKMVVDKEIVTVTFYETTLKILVQGGPKSVKFAEDALIPYLEKEIAAEKKAIKDVNKAALKSKYVCDVCDDHFETKTKLNKHFDGHMKSNPVAPTKILRRKSNLDDSGGLDIFRCQEILAGSGGLEMENNKEVVASLIAEVVEASSVAPPRLDGQQSTKTPALKPPQEFQEFQSSQPETPQINLSKSQLLPNYCFMLDVYDDEVNSAKVGQKIHKCPLDGSNDKVEISEGFLAQNIKLQFNFSTLPSPIGQKTPPPQDVQNTQEKCTYLCIICGNEFDEGEKLDKHEEWHHRGFGKKQMLGVTTLLDSSQGVEGQQHQTGLTYPSNYSQGVEVRQVLKQQTGILDRVPNSSQGVEGQPLLNQQQGALNPSATSWLPGLQTFTPSTVSLSPLPPTSRGLEKENTMPEGWKKHTCEICEHKASFVLDIWKHKAEVHGECLEEEFLLYVFAEQNFEMGERVRRLQQSVQSNMNHEGATLADVVESQAQSIINDAKIKKRLDDLEKKSKGDKHNSILANPTVKSKEEVDAGNNHEYETCTVCQEIFRKGAALQDHILARHCVQSREMTELLKIHQELLNTIITSQVKQQNVIENIEKDIKHIRQTPLTPISGVPMQTPAPLHVQPLVAPHPLTHQAPESTSTPHSIQPPLHQPVPQPSNPPPLPSPPSLLQPHYLQLPRLPAWPQPAAPTRFTVPPTPQVSQKKQDPVLPESWKPKIGFVADSIGHNANFEILEKATGAKIKRSKAYCSKSGGKFPMKNFTDVVPKAMSEEQFEYLVVQASSTDLTNLNGLPVDTVNEYYRQQASLSSYQMVASVDSALTSYPNLKGVVLMERTPRYDNLHDLNLYANSVLHEAVASSRNLNKIFIGQHTLQCEGGLRASRYGAPASHHNYDGIHLRGTSGRMAYTRSVASIFQQAGILSSPLQVIVPKMNSRSSSKNHVNFQPADRRRGFINQSRRQESFQSVGRSKGFSQQQNKTPVPLMEQEFNLPTQNRFQVFC